MAWTVCVSPRRSHRLSYGIRSVVFPVDGRARIVETVPIGDILLIAAVVFAINLLPAFGPPTWAVLIALGFQLDLPPVPLVAVGAVAAACGRLVLAGAARGLRDRLSSQRRRHLESLRAAVTDHPAGAVAGLALFAVSPVPSGQLFVAAGVTGVRLLPLTAAFFAGRIVSYALYVGAASAAEQSLGPALTDVLGHPVAIALQLLLLGGLVLLVRTDWTDVLERRRARRGDR